MNEHPGQSSSAGPCAITPTCPKGCWYRRTLSSAWLRRHLEVSVGASAYLTASGSGLGRAE